METFDEPLFAWVIDGKPATQYTLGKLTGRLIAQINGMPFERTDGQLYHFTTGASGLAILNSGVLRMTDYNDLADGSELRHGLELAGSTLREYDDELSRETVSLFEEVLSASPPLRTFVACFSLLKESPKHWADYAGNGTGIAIGFEPEDFYALTSTDPRAISFTRVAYDEVVKTGVLVGLSVVVDDAVHLDQSRGLYDRKTYLAEIRRLVLDLAPLCKKEKYIDEHEVRLIAVPELSLSGVAHDLKPSEYETDRGVRAYVTTREIVSDFVLPVTRVVIGPAASAETRDGIVALAARFGVPVEQQ
jgi:hypothetical protein